VTTATAPEVARRRGAPRKPRNIASALGTAFVAAALALGVGGGETWPSPKYQADPVGFARDVLGTETWEKQTEIVESVRDHRNTSVRSGHKCGKTTALAIVALWFYSSFDEARVLMTAVKASQVDEAMWREVRRLYKRAKKRGHDLGGVLGERANYGLRADDGRQIWGMTARDGEGLAGISGPNVLVLADEASGIKDQFFEVLGSSLAGSGGVVRKCYISNPTRTTGEFYRSHTVNKALFNCIHASSEETPNARGTGVFPGLAGPEWIVEKKAEYGEESPQYRIRVKGEFVHDKDGKIISLNLIDLAKLAWAEAADEGDLQFGVDPAGDGVIGDETAIAVRRGAKIITVPAWRGLSEDQVVEHVVEMVRHFRRPGDPPPRVTVDCEGGIGARVLGKLRAHLDKYPNEFRLVPVRSGKKLWGSPEFDKVRDGLWGHTAKWLLAGGAIPTDAKLEQELNAPSFTADANQRYVATDKKTLRKELGRSPDRADAVCLSIWGYEQSDSHEEDDESAAKTSAEIDDVDAIGRGLNDPGAIFDPYGGAG
jgi:phage terminase large subunit